MSECWKDLVISFSVCEYNEADNPKSGCKDHAEGSITMRWGSDIPIGAYVTVSRMPLRSTTENE